MEQVIRNMMYNVKKTETCWVWQGAVRGGPRNEYGVMKVGGRNGKVLYCHRMSYEFHKGPIPPGNMVLHSCNNKRCVNPEHLSLGDAKTNAQQARRDGLVTMPHERESYQHPFAGTSLRSKWKEERREREANK